MSKTGDLTVTEQCTRCRGKTKHLTSLEIRQHKSDAPNREYSRHPVRVTTCTVCGHESEEQMAQ